MSRVGRQPISLPQGVDVQIQPRQVEVKGPNGNLQVPVHPLTEVELDDRTLRVTVHRPNDRQSKAMWGLVRSLLANAVEGVTKGFEKRLVVVGIGYRAEVKGKALDLQVGYSQPVTIAPLPGIEFGVEAAPPNLDAAQASIVIRGADKELVGRTAANIRAVRRPEPYKGKGIRYLDEYVRRKAGKAAVT